MDIMSIKKPTLKKPYKSPYTYTQSDMDFMNRKRMRANELGIMLFVLDGNDSPSELQELEDYIVDNYIDMDLDVPEDLKSKYLLLKQSTEKSTV